MHNISIKLILLKAMLIWLNQKTICKLRFFLRLTFGSFKYRHYKQKTFFRFTFIGKKYKLTFIYFQAGDYQLGNCRIRWAFVLAVVAFFDSIILGCLAFTLAGEKQL